MTHLYHTKKRKTKKAKATAYLVYIYVYSVHTKPHGHLLNLEGRASYYILHITHIVNKPTGKRQEGYDGA